MRAMLMLVVMCASAGTALAEGGAAADCGACEYWQAQTSGLPPCGWGAALARGVPALIWPTLVEKKKLGCDDWNLYRDAAQRCKLIRDFRAAAERYKAGFSARVQEADSLNSQPLPEPPGDDVSKEAAAYREWRTRFCVRRLKVRQALKSELWWLEKFGRKAACSGQDWVTPEIQALHAAHAAKLTEMIADRRRDSLCAEVERSAARVESPQGKSKPAAMGPASSD